MTLLDVFPGLSAASLASFKGIFINENLTSHRRELLNREHKDNVISSACTIYGKVFIKVLPTRTLIRVYDKNELEDL